MKLFLVTINYNGSQDTITLLNSLAQQTDLDFHTIVVDNGSSPEDFITLDQLGLKEPIHLIRNEKNLGFSGGNNVGTKAALDKGADWVLWINNDTHVEPHFITELKRGLSNREGIAALPIQEGDRTAYAGRVDWLRPTLLHEYQPVNATSRYYGIGAGLAVHRSALEKMGMLDERYFLYFEDADYSMRAHKAKVPFLFLTKPKVHHKISQTTKKIGSPLLLRYHYRNMFLFNIKHAPAWVKLLLPAWGILGIVKQLIKLLILPAERAQSQAIIDGITDYLKGRFGKLHA